MLTCLNLATFKIMPQVNSILLQASTFKGLLELIPQLLWVEKTDGTLFYSNRLDIKNDVKAIQIISELIHPDDRFLFRRNYENARLYNRLVEVKCRIKQSEEYRWHLFQYGPFKDSGDMEAAWYGSAEDIQSLYDSHLRETISAPSFKELANAMPQLVWVAEHNGDVIYYNDRISEFHGARQNDHGSWQWEGLLHPDDAVKTSDAWTAALNSHHLYEIEHRVLMKNGDYRWMLSRGLPVLDEKGKVLRWYGTATDIHAIKTAEALNAARELEIREAKNQLELSLSAGNIGLWNWNLLNGKIQWSDYLCSLYGLKPEEWTERIEQFWPMVHPEDKERLMVEAGISTPSEPYVKYRFRFLRKDGQWRWMEARSKTNFSADGQPQSMIGVNIDITDQMLAAEVLRESESRFRTLAEGLPQMIWVTDAEGKAQYYSSNWKTYTGESDFETLWAKVAHPDDLEPSRAAWAEALSAGLPFRYEVRIRNAAGEYRWHFSVGHPIRDANGNIEKWIGSLSDISEQKNFSEHLEKLVRQRTLELQQSNDDLAQFAHVASHDLKEPLRKIQMFINLLQTDFQKDLSETATLYMNKIVKSVDRMNSMIEGVLKYSGLDAYDLNQEKVDLNEVLTDVQDDLEVMIRESSATLICGVLPKVNGFKLLLYQLIYNLVYNSLKFRKKDLPPLITISSEISDRQGFQLKVTVEDNGIGFDTSQSETIFKTFKRLHSKDQFEGSGLGLALCKKIMERHGGTISAEGEVGKGAKFHLYFSEK